MHSRPPSPAASPLVGHTLEYARDPFSFVDRAVDEVGDVVRAEVVGVGDLYLLAHPDHLEQALALERDAFEKNHSFTIAFGESVIAVEGEQWERQREAVEEFFYPGRIRSYADQMVALSENRIERWADGDRISIRDQMTELALEILFGTLFDRRVAVDGDERLRRAAGDLNARFEPTTWVLPPWVPTPARRRYRRARETIDREARRLLADRKREGADGDDLLSTLVTLRATGDADLSDAEIVDQLLGLVFAGHETTALALTYAWHAIGTDPAVRERFYDELDAVLDGSAPTLADVDDLEVTGRIVRESLRRYPPVHTLPRETTRPVDVGDYRLPRGALVHLSTYRVHRDERFWDDPLEFRPERWRGTSPGEKGYAYAPFGAGPRACLGRRFALLEATLALATIGRRYRLEPLSELELEPEMTTQPVDDVPARVFER